MSCEHDSTGVQPKRVEPAQAPSPTSKAPCLRETGPLSKGSPEGDARTTSHAWRGYLVVVLALILIKTVVIAWGVYAGRYGELSLRDYERNYHHHRIIGRYEDPARFDFFELWVVSDAQWYNAIAQDGYPSREQFDIDDVTTRPKLIATTDTQLKYVFFPLWPLTIRVVQVVIREVNAAGFFAANLISLIALVGLYGFLARRVGARAAFWTVVLFAASPFALFFHVPFTESLFLLLAVLTLVTCERRWWFPCGVCIGLGMVTRPNGIALVAIPLVYTVVEAVRCPGWLRTQFPRMLGLLVAVLPPAVFLWHNAAKAGDPFYFTQATDWWGYHEGTLWANLCHNTYETAAEFTRLPWHGFHRSKLDFIVLGLSVVVLLLGLRVVPLHYAAYAGCVLLIPLLAKDLMSYCRYALLAWPLFLVLVLLVREEFRRWVFGALSVVFLLGQMTNVAAFVNWHWVG